MTWETLQTELKAISAEPPNSLLSTLMAINMLLWPDESAGDTSLRKVNFMTYELLTRCKDLCEEDRLHTLNSYFFDQKEFRIVLSDTHPNKHRLSLLNILSSTQGNGLPLSLLYTHWAAQLDLPVYLVKSPYFCLVKWVRGKNSVYIDLNQSGKILNDSDLLKIVNQSSLCRSYSCLEILSAQQILIEYVQKLLFLFKESYQRPHQLLCLNILVVLAPEELNYLADRALLLKDLDRTYESLNDLKRYFSFMDFSQAPKSLVLALYELDPTFYAQNTHHSLRPENSTPLVH